MKEYMRFLDGGTEAAAPVSQIRRYVETLLYAEAPGPGWYEVVKDSDKPTPGPGETLYVSYALDGGVCRKSYSVVPDTPTPPPSGDAIARIVEALSEIEAPGDDATQKAVRETVAAVVSALKGLSAAGS